MKIFLKKCKEYKISFNLNKFASIQIVRQFKTIGCPRLDYGCIIILCRTYMDAQSKNLFRNMLDVKNSKPSSKIEVGHKGKTFYFERRNYVQGGKTRHKLMHCLANLIVNLKVGPTNLAIQNNLPRTLSINSILQGKK